MGNFATSYDYAPPAKRMSESTRQSLRRLGFVLMIITALVLSYDAYHLFSHTVTVKLSGFLDIWKHVDNQSLNILQSFVVASLGSSFWYSLLAPLLSAPVVIVMGIPALILLRTASEEVQARTPTVQQMEAENMGLANGRRRRHR